MNKINLIYIASIGRSGTTLFESVLGAHPDIVTCGEIQLWPHEIIEGGVLPTGSGQFVQESAFWQEMERSVDPLNQPFPQIHYFRETHTAGRTLRLERLYDFSNSENPSEVERKIRQYGVNNYRLFERFINQVERETGNRPKWIVDASKDVYRLLWLIQCGLFNVKVVHMVKDPRGFIYSVTKPWIRNGKRASDAARLYYTFRQSVAWVIRNFLYKRVAKNHIDSGDYMLIRYEDLACDPEGVMKSACRMIGCDYDAAMIQNFREGSPFAIAGNPMRQDDRPIQLDERWKRDLPFSSRLLAQAITSLNKRQFGYGNSRRSTGRATINEGTYTQ